MKPLPTHFANCFFFAAFSFCVTGVIILSVGEMKLGLLSLASFQISTKRQDRYTTYWPFAIFFWSKAFAPIPGLPSWAAFEGLWRGWTAGDSLGVDVADMAARGIQRTMVVVEFEETNLELGGSRLHLPT